MIAQNKGKLLTKIEEISGGKAHTNTRKFIRNISTVTEVFLNQKRVNVCEHTVKAVLGRQERWKLPEANTRLCLEARMY